MTQNTCNAVLANDEGRCQRPAGYMTDHPGEGKCYAHGGLKPPAVDDFRATMDAYGLGGIISVAESLSRDEIEYLSHVSSAALITIRARYVAMLADPERTPKEAADLSLALRRVEASINALKDGTPLGTLSDEEAIALTEAEDQERERLESLRERFGTA